MRLLEVLPNGGFRLTKNLDNAIPPYAILSHRWEDESQEVTFEDIDKGSGRGKAGYKKVEFCGEQAARDGLRYFWVDSCCIKKSSDAELSESLNSMFRWYHRAEKCYVYLSDVSSDVSTGKRRRGDKDALNTWAQAFRGSKWFTRGWTLQELLAPTLVEFFSREGNRLGDKQSLEQCIHEITGVPILALQGLSLSQFSVDERFKWAKNRKTTREEDWVYSLLGIFGIFMSVIYGEGKESAVNRLRKEVDDASKCLRDLCVTDPRADKTRIEETKGGLIRDSYRWILDNCDFRQWRNDLQSRLLWIKGDPGKGKTMLLCGIIDELRESTAETHLLSFFFCQATDSRINNATAVLRGLVYLLVDQHPYLITHIRKKYHLHKTIFEDTNAWVATSGIFTDILHDPSLKMKDTYLVIDALDECVADLPRLLKLIVQECAVSPHVKWIVSSRYGRAIEQTLRPNRSRALLSLELKENADRVGDAVDIYIDRCVCKLAETNRYDQQDKHLQEKVRETMRRKANGTFLWVSIVTKELEDVMSCDVLQVIDALPSELIEVYQRMVQQIEARQQRDRERCLLVLSTATAAYRPLRLEELGVLSGLSSDIAGKPELVTMIVNMCGSFLTIQDEYVYIIHQSASDFLSREGSSFIFPSGTKDVHYRVFSTSIQVMLKMLKRNIYNLPTPGFPIDEVQQPKQDPLAAARYSCVYWIDHLCDSSGAAGHYDVLRDGGIVDNFIREKCLHWLEALSLSKAMSKGVLAMAKLEKFVQDKADTPALFELVHDAHRFLMYNKQGIEISPLQAYTSALIFSPTDSLIRRHFQKEEPKWITIKPTIGEKWTPCLQTLEGHSDMVTSVAFTHNSTRLASASKDRTVKIWDTSSGDCLRTLEAHRGLVTSVDFSNDSTQLASASTSTDCIVQIWDANSGDCLWTLKGHRGLVTSVAFSHDSIRLASTSEDCTVKIWNTNNGVCLRTLKGHNSRVASVIFSNDLIRLASTSADYTVKIWDVNNGDCLWTLEGHGYWITLVAFLNDSTQLMSASIYCTVKIWDTSSGACLRTFPGYGKWVTSVAFSHDLTWLASTLDDRTVKIWSPSSGDCLRTFKGHRDLVTSVAFSHNSTRLASASADHTVKIWDVNSNDYLQTFEAHNNSVTSVAFSHDSTQLASASKDCTVKIWNASSGDCLQTLKGHDYQITSVAFSHDSAWLASASDDWTVKIWSVSSGDCLQTLKDHNSWVTSVTFSHNSTRLASASADNTVKIWNVSSDNCLQTLKGHNNSVKSVIFSYDSTQLASSADCTIKIWSASSGDCLRTLKGHNNWVTSIAFSHDSTRLASALVNYTVMIWDVSSGDRLYTLSTSKVLYNISFDTTGLYLHTDTGTVAVDVMSASNITLDRVKRQNPRYQGVGLSSNGAWITYNSENLIWLPSEYRPSCSAVSGRMIGIGVGSGKVWMCNFQYTGFEHC